MSKIALRGDLVGAERTPPSAFRIFAPGVNGSENGDFLFDAEAAAAVMRKYRQHRADLSIDYDHQALRTPEVKAPAAGWFSLEVRDGELWACNVRWTPAAQEHLEAAEYRYFSPLIEYDESTRRITNLINLALTNTPALHGIDALVAASVHARGGTVMPTPIQSSDQLAVRAYICSQTGTTMPAESRAALSSLTGTASKRAALAIKSDEQILAEAHPTQREIIEHGYVGKKAQSARAREMALHALDVADREARVALVERGRMLSRQGS